ncbi:hypothetical protein [Halorientalis litorea]|jgi:ribosomal protein S18 acetylase RimI-like enzyme|uniref:hypothetical protein n=1 Tax=Halorientalis litorea TaxID=2931977 RepID=UPI001FF6E3DF|nr:hypothetical protein [Halorientalis litorea]
MSENRQNRSDEAQHDELRGAVRGVVSAAETAPTTAGIAETLSLSRETTRDILAELAQRGTLRKQDDGGVTRWQETATDVLLNESANSYEVSDPETGIVSRAGTRPEALRQLADRLDQYADGEAIGAQIMGIGEAVLSPAYVQGIESLIEDYVEPDDKHLYVYVPEEGIREIRGQEHLHREHEVGGFAVTGRFTREEFDAAIQVPVDRLLAETPIDDDDFPLSVFKLVAIHPDYQGQGIGMSLVTHGMAYLAENPPVVGMLWERESDANVAIAEQHGAERLAEFENTSPSKWQCPECGFDTPCTCKSAFYGWGFE